MSGRRPLGLDAAPDRTLGRDLDRIGRDGQRSDAELVEMPEPGSLIAKVPLGMLRQAGGHRSRQRPLPHVGERLGVDHVVGIAGSQHLKEVQPALRAGGREGGEVLVPELGADAVLVLVASTGIVDADPTRRAQPGPQHLRHLVEEGALALVQQPDELALGDRDADRPQLSQQTRHGHLALVVLEQHEPAQLRPEVADDPGRHRGSHGPAVGREPALTAESDHVRTQHQVLDQEVLIALEARARGDLRRDHPLLVNAEPPGLAAPGPTASVPCVRLGLGALLHAARPQLGAVLHAFEGRDLRPQLGDRLPQGSVLGQQLLGKGLQFAARQARKADLLRRRHARHRSGPSRPGATASAHLGPGFCPSYHFLQRTMIRVARQQRALPWCVNMAHQ